MRTDKSHYAGIERMLQQGDYPGAIQQIESARKKSYTYKDRVVYFLDIGMLHHWNGDYTKSNEFLEQAERAIEENFTKSLSRAASSLILNDNTLEYAGEDYENIYLNVFKALNYLALNQQDAAFVEVRRINDKLTQLDSKHVRLADKMNQAEEAHETFRPARSRFVESALGRYLSMLLYRADYKWDDVRIDREKIEKAWTIQPDIHPWPLPDFSRVTERLPSDTGRLNILVFIGRAPEKTASSFYIHTEENLIILAGTSENYLGRQRLSGLNTLAWPEVPAGYHFKLQLPTMRPQPSRVARIEVETATETEPLQMLESLEQAALETFAIKKPLIYLKTLTRTVVKGLASEQAKQELTEDMGRGAALFARIATDLMVDQTENADLRVSRFFPSEAGFCELHLKKGTYTVRIRYYAVDGTLLHTDEHTAVEIAPGQLNVLESAYLN